MISRRRFLQATGATGALLAFPFRAFPFSQSVAGIKKFMVPLPGLIPETSNARGIPVLTPTSTNGTDVYSISATAFSQNLLGEAVPSPLPTKLWGYASLAPGAAGPQYLGGVIVATRDKPVELNIINELPPLHILPVDTSLIDPASGEPSTGERQDRIAVHLHGGFVFWAYDGGPFLWFANPANGGPEVGASFANPGPGGDGTAVYLYPNQQSARFLWYHDHAYGLTRTNAYAGLASAYLIMDNIGDGGEMDMIEAGVIPGKGFDPFTPPGLLGVPLIIQDKTFWDGPEGNDPAYENPGVVPAGPPAIGDLWYPHVYESALADALPDMALPPVSPLGNARWEIAPPPTTPLPQISSVPEFFSDTILVNGAPYPTMNVVQQRYRFRFLNASQGRFYNLQLYVAAEFNLDGTTPNPDGINLQAVPGQFDPNGNPVLKPANAPGPAFIQIANEAGFLPAPALFSTDPVTNLNSNFELQYNPGPAGVAGFRGQHHHADAGRAIRFQGDLILFAASPNDPTIGSVTQHNLVMAPAERPDVIIDFRPPAGVSWGAGTEFILYNDAPAPFPGGDTRNDYFIVPDPALAGLPEGWSNDLTAINGAAPAPQGEGPDTRILMKFVLTTDMPENPDELSFADTVAALQNPTTPTGLPTVFKTAHIQDPLLVSTVTGLTETPTVGRVLVKTLGEDFDEFGRLRQYLGNTSAALRTFLDFPTDVANEGEIQTWQIYNTTADTHPMHFHLVNVQVLGRDNWAFNPADGTPILPLQIQPGTHTDPEPNEMGWRETVRMNPGTVTTVAMKFDLPAAPAVEPKNSPRLLASYGIDGAEYVWHCHILEHEEHDMMRPLVVIPKNESLTPTTTPTPATATTPQKK